MLEFILFAFLVTPTGYYHIGWYVESERDRCRARVAQLNAAMPHTKGVISKEYALCRCFHCGPGKF